jgi:site-specific DNA-cytosine methylase
MNKDSIQVISDALGVDPYKVNSRDYSAQNRPRLYWTNLPFKGTENTNTQVVEDILDDDAVFSNDYPNYLDLQWGEETRKSRLKYSDDKSRTLMATMWKGQICTFVRNRKEEVHRLTPTECERLQGLPTNYTAKGISVDGDEVKISNTQRYKSLGNSWNAPTIEQFFKGI